MKRVRLYLNRTRAKLSPVMAPVIVRPIIVTVRTVIVVAIRPVVGPIIMVVRPVIVSIGPIVVIPPIVIGLLDWRFSADGTLDRGPARG